MGGQASTPGRRAGGAALLAAVALAPGLAAQTDPSGPYSARFAEAGIAVEFSMERLHRRESDAALQEGEDVRIRFGISDTATRTALESVYPAAWMDLRAAGAPTPPRVCAKKAETFVGGSLFSKAELDLNVYYVMALNDDATVSVVDPLFGFGGSKLITMIALPAPGEDWVITEDQRRVFVTVPDVGQVTVIDTPSWEVSANLDVGIRPARIALQPDEHYLWVVREGSGPGAGRAGVTVLDTASLAVVAHIETGRGAHDIGFSDDSRFAYVANREDGSVTAIDTGTLQAVAQIQTGPRPSSLAWSTIAQAMYVAHEGDGAIVAIAAERHTVTARMQARPGLGQIRFAPGGRLGFVVNPAEDEVHVIDSATNRIVQSGGMEDKPDRIAFSDELAYVSHRGSETVLMLPLDEMGREGAPLQAVDFPGGDKPPGDGSTPSAADVIVQAPGANAVLVANAADRSIYFYKEGMAAPMGSFSNYGMMPRAVMVVDRSLRARSSPGVYETIARLRRPGQYDVVFFMDSPRVIHCFEVTVAADPALERQRQAGKLDITPLFDGRSVAVGERIPMRFRIAEELTKTPKVDLDDVYVLVYLAPGVWHAREAATHAGGGVYTADFVLPRPGVYYAHVAARSLGVTFSNPQYMILRAVQGPPEQAESRGNAAGARAAPTQ